MQANRNSGYTILRRIAWGSASLALVASAVLAFLFERSNTEVAELDNEARLLAPGDFVDLEDGSTHFELGGPNTGQAVILVHGFSVPYYIWDTTFDALVAEGFRVLRYDIFGRGYSDRPDVAYDGALFERQVSGLIDRLALQEPVDLIGLSMGGAVVMRFAANNPESVRKVVLVDPSHQGGAPPPYPRIVGSYVIAVRVIPGLAEGQLTDFLYPDNYPTWVDQYRVQMKYEGFRNAITSTIYEFSTEDHLANYRRVNDTDIPVMLVWGVQDRTLDISGADTVMGVLEVDYLPVDDAGHLPHIEQADIVNPAIAEFLR